MKYILSIFLGYSLLFTGYSQVYHPIPEKDAWWCESYCWGDAFCSYYEQNTIHPGPQIMFDSLLYTTYIYEGSVYIPANGNHCQEQNYWVSGYLYAYLRNDSINQRVYRYEPYYSTEYLLYDFNVSVGDTIPSQGIYYLDEDQFVDAIDSVDIGLGYRKRIYLHSANDDDVWIEGIGSKISLRQRSYYTTHCRHNISFSQDNNTYPPEFFGFCEAPIGIETVESLMNFLKPLGSNQWMLINHSKAMNISCMDLMGHELFSKIYDENEMVDLNNLATGIYILSAFMDGKPCRPFKVMVQH